MEECEFCFETGCDGLKNCRCGEDMTCTESECTNCKNQERDNNFDGQHSY